MLGRSMLRAALRLCCLPEQTIDGIERRHMQRDDGGAHLICYLDGMSEELVRRQLEFRRLRKSTRDASYNSLTSLGTLSEDGSEALLPRVQSLPVVARFATGG